MLKRTDITYGQLDRALRALGFSCRLKEGDPPARVYEHKETGAYFSTPPFPAADFVLAYHLEGARVTVDRFGIADRQAFDTQLQKAA